MRISGWLFVCTFLFIATLASPALAQDTLILEGVDVAAGTAGFADPAAQTPEAIVAGIVNTVIGLTGIAFVILLLYGGILYMTAGGDTDRVQKAKSTMISAVIGLVIVVAAFAITTFLFNQLITATSATPEAATTPAS